MAPYTEQSLHAPLLQPVKLEEGEAEGREDAAALAGHANEKEANGNGKLAGKLLADISAALLASFLMLTNTMSYAGFMCVVPVFKPIFSAIAVQSLWAIFWSALPLLSLSGYETVATLDPLAAQFITQAAGEVVASLPNASSEVQMLNAFLLVPLFTAILGIALFLIGYFRGGIILKFIPFIVSAGLVGGFGLILVYNSIKLAIVVPVENLIDAAAQSIEGSTAARFTVLLAVIRLSLALLVALLLERCNRQPIGKPLVLVMTAGVFAWAANMLPDSKILHAQGWFMELGSGGSGIFTPWELAASAVHHVHFHAIFSMGVLRELVTFLVFIIIEWCLHFPPMDKMLRIREGKVVKHDDEIKIAGYMSLGCSFLGMSCPGCHAIMIPLAVKFGGKYWAQGATAIHTIMLFTGAWTAVVNIPTFGFASLIFLGGIHLVQEWIVESRERISMGEWRLLVVTSFAIWYDAMLGLVLGFAISMMFFVVEYAGVTGVHKSGTLLDYRSNVDRTPAEKAIIDEMGATVQIYFLQGYLYFGSVSRLQDEVRAIILKGVKTIIIDFSFVPAVDATGVYGIVDMSKYLEAEGVRLVLAGMVRRLRLAVTNAERKLAEMDDDKDGYGIRLAADLDSAIARCEDKLLKQRGIMPPAAWSLVPTEVWEHKLNGPCPRGLATASRVLDFPEGSHLYEDGDVAEQLFIVLAGEVYVETWAPEKNCIRRPNDMHLNKEKDDKFVFEVRPDRRLARPGSVIAALECIHVVSGRAVACLGTAKAHSAVKVLSLNCDDVSMMLTNELFRTWFMRVVAEQAAPFVGLDSFRRARQVSHLE